MGRRSCRRLGTDGHRRREALRRAERPVSGAPARAEQPPAAAQADGAERDAVSREHPATGAGSHLRRLRPTGRSGTRCRGSIRRRGRRSHLRRLRPTGRSGTRCRGSIRRRGRGSHLRWLRPTGRRGAASREHPVTGRAHLRLLRSTGRRRCCRNGPSVGSPRAAARTGGPGAEVVSWERPATGPYPVTGPPPAASQADGPEPEVVPRERPATRAHPVTGPPPVARAAVVLPDEPRAASEARAAGARSGRAALDLCSAREADGPAPHRRSCRGGAETMRGAGVGVPGGPAFRSTPGADSGSPAVRRARGDHRSLQARLRRPHATARRGHEARGRRGDLGPGVGRLEALHVHLGDARRRDGAAAEAILVDHHHGVLHGGVAVDVDVLHVHHGRVVDDHVVHDAWATPAAPCRHVGETRPPPPGHERLTPPERHPAQDRPADADADAQTGPAEERDEGGSIHRPRDHRPRRPAPEAVHGDPAPMVIGRPTPRRGVDPGPAVGRIERPGSRRVRGPSGLHRGRDPDGAVGGNGSPRPIAVEIAHAVRPGGDVAGAHRVQLRFAAGVVPFVPVIELRRRVGGDPRARRALDDDFLARRDDNGRPAGRGDGGLAASAGDERRALPRDVHAVVARVLDGEGRVRRGHLHRGPGLDRAKVKGRGTRGHLELEKARLLVRQADLGIGPPAHERA